MENKNKPTEAERIVKRFVDLDMPINKAKKCALITVDELRDDYKETLTYQVVDEETYCSYINYFDWLCEEIIKLDNVW